MPGNAGCLDMSEPSPTASVSKGPIASHGFAGTTCMDVAAPDDPSTDADPSAPVEALDPSIQTVWRIKAVGFGLLLLLPAVFYDLTHLLSAESWLPFGLLSGSLFVFTAIYVALWPWLRYRAWAFGLWSEELYREHGVLIHVRTIVPLRRIQHVDVSQDILEREFALGRLVVHTAGSRSSDVVIPGLPLPKAERIRDEIKRFILEDPLLEDPV